MKEENVDMEIIVPKGEENDIIPESEEETVLEEESVQEEETALEESPVAESTEEEAPEPIFSEKKTNKVIDALVQDDDEENPRSLRGWKDIIKALDINGQWFKKQIKVIVLIVICIIAYITNRYQAQQEIIDEEILRKEFQDWKFRSLTRNSELTLKTRQSKLEEQLKILGDSTLKPNSDTKYRIVKDKK